MQKTIISFLIGFCVSIIIAPIIIKCMVKLKGEQPILGYVETHQKKSGTPTMGGLIFIIGIIIDMLFFISNNNKLSTICLFTLISYGIIGFLDDFIKIKFKHNMGLKPYQKIIGQVGIAILIAVFIYYSPYVGGDVIIPFSNKIFNIGLWVIPFSIFIFLATTNSVNLLDGLDGLAGSVSFIFLIGFIGLFNSYIGRLEYLGESIIYIQELKNMSILVAGLCGSLLAFLCFNSYPAKIFMGDTGSLALGGFIGAVCCLSKMYLYLPLLGFMYVITALSVIIQVVSYKLTKKRVFLMAPLHHHFEKKGCYETKIVAIYIIITIVLVVFTNIFQF